MPTEITITAYKYEELDGRAKEKARAKLTEWVTDHEWWDGVYDIAKEDGQAKGFDIEDIRFRGFWSQGDGAHWTGRVDMPAFIEANLDENSAYYASDVVLQTIWAEGGWIDRFVTIHNTSYRYCHSGGMRLGEYAGADLILEEDDDNDHNVLKKEGPLQGASIYQLVQSMPYDMYVRINEWCDEALEQAKSFADDIYKKLSDGYDDITSEESLTEFAGANGYLFDERGEHAMKKEDWVVSAPVILTVEGLDFTVHNGGQHIVIKRDNGKEYHLWPSTGKWRAKHPYVSTVGAGWGISSDSVNSQYQGVRGLVRYLKGE